MPNMVSVHIHSWFHSTCLMSVLCVMSTLPYENTRLIIFLNYIPCLMNTQIFSNYLQFATAVNHNIT